MKNITFQQLDLKIHPDEPVFVIGVVSEMVHIPIWTLRKLDEMGVVKPKRINKKIRCYSAIQIKQLNYVQYLMEDKGINVSGVKMIFSMELKKEDAAWMKL